MVIIEKGNTIHMVSVGSLKKLKGFAAGVSTKGLRDERDRFD